MSFRAYLESHYIAACNLQRGISRDPQMIAMLRDGPQDVSLVKSWMRDYGLFQGITSQNREAIVNRFIAFSRSHTKTSLVSREALSELYSELFTALYREVARSWMSATSKLLWCLYPDDIVIYDAFVHRTLVVMQCIDGDLSGFPRIGPTPKIEKETDIEIATVHYMNYQDMVRKLLSVHAKALSDLRRVNSETYQYDIRILDKLLWMIGDTKRAY